MSGFGHGLRTAAGAVTTAAVASFLTVPGAHAETGDKAGTTGKPTIMTQADKNGLFSARAISPDGPEAIVAAGCFKGPNGFRPVVLVQSRQSAQESPVGNSALFKLGSFRDACDGAGNVNQIAVIEEAKKALFAYTTYQIGAPQRTARKASAQPSVARPQ
jgi:hypothetical protein